MFKEYSREDKPLKCATTNFSQMAEERMLYITFLVNVIVYFAETRQWFDARVQQHQTAIKNLDMKNGIAAHVTQTGHMIKWCEAKYIDHHNYSANRKMK